MEKSQIEDKFLIIALSSLFNETNTVYVINMREKKIILIWYFTILTLTENNK